MYEISLTHTIDTGHRIVGHEGGRGKCARLHGHTYRYEVTIASPSLLPIGFVVDFGAVKKALDQWDHMLLLWEEDPLVHFVDKFMEDHPLVGAHRTDILGGLVTVPFNPTAENMAEHWAWDLLQEVQMQHLPLHPGGIKDVAVQVEVWETPKSSARFVAR